MANLIIKVKKFKIHHYYSYLYPVTSHILIIVGAVDIEISNLLVQVTETLIYGILVNLVVPTYLISQPIPIAIKK